MADFQTAERKARALLLRDEVTAELSALGVRDAQSPAASLPPGRRMMFDSASILGLPFHVNVRCSAAMNLSEAQDAAQLAARERGKELFAVVHPRRGHGLRLSYCVMPLYVFGSVIRQMQNDVLVRDDLSASSVL